MRLFREWKGFLIIFLALVISLIGINTNEVKANSDKVDEIFSQGEKGPINLENEQIGVFQIQNAGIDDANFAKAIWKSLKKVSYTGTSNQTIRQILSEYKGDIDARLCNIKNIYGIDYLRSAKSILLDNDLNSLNENTNKIEDLTPLSMDYLVNKYEIQDIEELMFWFGKREIRDNVLITITGNPIVKYMELCGAIQLRYSGGAVNCEKLSDLVFIKANNEKFEGIKEYAIPRIYKDGRLVRLNQERSDLSYSDGALLDKSMLLDYFIKIYNINHSQIIDFTYANDPIDNICFYKKNFIGGQQGVYASIDAISIRKEILFYTYVYYPIFINDENNINVKVIKYEDKIDSSKLVEGAVYHLFDNNDERVNDQEYITDKNGEICLREELKSGKYYLKETKAPEGYECNQEKLYFDVNISSINITGGKSNPDVNVEGSASAEEGVIYIDRYSDPINITLDEAENNPLDYIEITYFDRDIQQNKTVPQKFYSAEDATKWINDNKGNTQTLGIIDGPVNIKANFKESEKEIVLKTFNKKINKGVNTGDKTNTLFFIGIIGLAILTIYSLSWSKFKLKK